MARLFQELKLDFDRKKQISDHTAPRFNLLMRTNSHAEKLLEYTLMDIL